MQRRRRGRRARASGRRAGASRARRRGEEEEDACAELLTGWTTQPLLPLLLLFLLPLRLGGGDDMVERADVADEVALVDVDTEGEDELGLITPAVNEEEDELERADACDTAGRGGRRGRHSGDGAGQARERAVDAASRLGRAAVRGRLIPLRPSRSRGCCWGTAAHSQWRWTWRWRRDSLSTPVWLSGNTMAYEQVVS